MPENAVSISLDPALEDAFASLTDMTSISEDDGNTVLTITGIEYKAFVAALMLIEPSSFISVTYDSLTSTATFVIAGTTGTIAAPTKQPRPDPTEHEDDSLEYCPDCVDGECSECHGEGYVDCNAYGCLNGSCMICFDGYETVSAGLNVKEIRCRTCGGDDECNTCRGNGEVRCNKCSNGRCSTCRGDGYIND